MKSTSLLHCRLAPAFIGLVLAAPSAGAAVYVVGTGSGCTHATVQAAINAAQANPGADTVRITRSQTWTAQELQVDTSQELSLVGGFDTCTTSEPSGMTTLSGAGGNPRQVLRVSMPGGGVVRLQHLMIRDADPSSDADGGGIYFSGNGVLELSDTSVIQNQAGYGAGIYARGTGHDARLVFGENVIVGFNTARHSGGGVYVHGIREFRMHAPGSVIMWNMAQGIGGGGYGGGLMVLSNGIAAAAYIGSGQPGLGSIVSNTAVYGGGVAVVGDDPGGATTVISSFASIRLQQTVADAPAGVRDNVASQRGGGLYLRPYADFDDTVSTDVWLFNTELEANTAPVGAAIYSDSSGDAPSSILINDPSSFPGGAGACQSGQDVCDRSGQAGRRGDDARGGRTQLPALSATGSPGLRNQHQLPRGHLSD